MIAEIRSCTLQAIERTNDDVFITSISTPSVSKDGPDLLGSWCSHVGIHNVTWFNLKVIKSRNGEYKTDSFTRENARLGLALGRFGHMPISYKYCFASEVFHFHSKYLVTMNLLITIRSTLSIRNNIKGNLYIINFLDSCIGPQCVTIIIIKLMNFTNCLG